MCVVMLSFMVKKFKKIFLNISSVLFIDKDFFCFWFEVLIKENFKRNFVFWIYMLNNDDIYRKLFIVLIKILGVLLVFCLGVIENNIRLFWFIF